VGALAAQPTGMRVNDGSWHYAALTYGDDTATVDLAEAAAVTPDKLLGDLMFVAPHAGHFHGALDELRVWDPVSDSVTAEVEKGVAASTSRWQIAERGGSSALVTTVCGRSGGRGAAVG
jgi:hypothetical protein